MLADALRALPDELLAALARTLPDEALDDGADADHPLVLDERRPKHPPPPAPTNAWIRS